jgi:hypothetical protein
VCLRTACQGQYCSSIGMHMPGTGMSLCAGPSPPVLRSRSFALTPRGSLRTIPLPLRSGNMATKLRVGIPVSKMVRTIHLPLAALAPRELLDDLRGFPAREGHAQACAGPQGVGISDLVTSRAETGVWENDEEQRRVLGKNFIQTYQLPADVADKIKRGGSASQHCRVL